MVGRYGIGAVLLAVVLAVLVVALRPQEATVQELSAALEAPTERAARPTEPADGSVTEVAPLSPPDAADVDQVAAADVNEVEHLFYRDGTIYLRVFGSADGAQFHALAHRLQATAGALEANYYSQLRTELERHEHIRNGQVTIEAMGCGRISCLVVLAAPSLEVAESLRLHPGLVSSESTRESWMSIGIEGITLTPIGAEYRVLFIRNTSLPIGFRSDVLPDDQ